MKYESLTTEGVTPCGSLAELETGLVFMAQSGPAKVFARPARTRPVDFCSPPGPGPKVSWVGPPGRSACFDPCSPVSNWEKWEFAVITHRCGRS
ncbi:hypothetical protein I4U23_000068 [Adineta vaga]|nr:hypothetical protein I4U23_000068 [Adineta vaga]